MVTSSPEMPFKKYRKCSSADSRQQRPALNGRPGVSGLKINHASGHLFCQLPCYPVGVGLGVYVGPGNDPTLATFLLHTHTQMH